ncbi:MAG TPA: TIGR03013 family XrtA/PEP-CTERM system glycosyltransferase [Candidatus Acidoferrales bacterium]|nr:TIGR03013 family XrtA/PEP-CTERM system glycosyltransferase [Candidatus Acidoferrales bacterium]
MLRIGSHQIPAQTLLLASVDTAAIVLALIAAIGLRFHGDSLRVLSDGLVWTKIALVTGVYWLCLYFNDLYDSRSVRMRAGLVRRIMRALGAGCVVLGLSYFALPRANVGRGIMLIGVPILFLFLMSWRFLAYTAKLFARGDERVLVVGTGEAGISLVRHILKHPEYNMKVVGFLHELGLDIGKSLVNPRIVGAVADVEGIVARERVDRVVLSLQERRGSTPVKQLLSLKLAGVRVEDVHTCRERLSGEISLEHLMPSWLFLSEGFEKSQILLAAKRAIDIVASFIILLLVSPLLPVIALAIYLETGRPIFFHQSRVGYKGREFELVKFRSMIQNAEKDGPQWASREDSRVTRVGRVLRKARLDEIPQLFNVLRGEMSLVGPRPERRIFCSLLEAKIPYFNLRHSVRPGLTGWAQVKFRYSASLDDAKEKLTFDLFYVKNLSILVDLAILFETVKVVLLGRGAH